MGNKNQSESLPHSSTISVPFNQAYWVIPGKLMAGCYPGSEVTAETDSNLAGLLNHGIRHFLNLMQPFEINRAGRLFVPYEEPLNKISATTGYEVTVERLAIKDMGIPSRIEMARILDRIDANIEQNRPVYLHCLGGIGRTGTVVGCYLARHGHASDQRLLRHIQFLRKNTINHHLMSPETNQQIDLILSWVEAE